MRELLVEIIMWIRAAWRYRWYSMLAAWLICIVGWSAVMMMPDVYESEARVYVDTESILRPLLRGLTIETDVRQRLGLMTKTLTSRPTLEKVARETDLDITVTSSKDKESLINRLEKDLQVKGGGRGNLYTISYEHQDPQVAKKVVQALLTIFVEDTLGNTRQDTESAQRFLDKQIQSYESKLIEAENKLTEFKRVNVGALPGQGGGVFNRLEQSKAAYETAKLQLNEALQKRNELKKQYASAQASIAAGTVKPVTAVDTRVLALQKKLDQLLLRFTEEHPDVKEIKQTIANLESQATDTTQSTNSSSLTKSTLLEQLKLSLGQAEAELAGIRVRVTEYSKRVVILKSLVNTLPQIETELKRLTRDHIINKKNYDALVSRRESARMAESAEAAGDNVKFRIIDPPRLPIAPASPNRPLLSILVLFSALGIGAAIAVLLSQIFPVVLDAKGLRRLTGYPVFGAVGRVWTPALLFKRKLEVSAFIVTLGVLIIVFAGVLVLDTYGTDLKWIYKLRGGL